MPFQVVNTSKKLPRFGVTLISAGDDQLIFCGDTVYLEARVDDPSKLEGHSLLWEQLEGAPVPLATPYQIATTYPFVETTDKVFRFWINKGTLVEQYRDVNIFHTPRAVCDIVIPNASVIRIVPSDPVPCDSITVEIVEHIPVPDGGHDDNVSVIYDIVIEWGLPTDPDLLPLLIQTVLYENGIPVYTALPSDPREYIGGTNTYSVLAEFNVRGQYSSEMSCIKDFTGLTLPDMRVINDTTEPLGLSNINTQYTRYTNAMVQTESLTEYGLSNVNYSVIQYSQLVNAGELTTYTSIGDGTVTIERFDPGGIGG
jgi:hypothetical protein